MRECLKQHPSNLICAANQEFRVISGSTPVQQNNISVPRSRVQSVSASPPQYLFFFFNHSQKNSSIKRTHYHPTNLEKHTSLGRNLKKQTKKQQRHFFLHISKLCLENLQYAKLRADFFFFCLNIDHGSFIVCIFSFV